MSRPNVFFVDDDPEELEIIREALKEMPPGMILHYEMNGENALEKLDTGFSSGLLPALIILDLNMPKMNGTQTLRALKSDKRFQDIPVIIYSTSVNTFEMAKCIDLGAYSYLTKPTTYAETLETVRLFLRVIGREE